MRAGPDMCRRGLAAYVKGRCLHKLRCWASGAPFPAAKLGAYGLRLLGLCGNHSRSLLVRDVREYFDSSKAPPMKSEARYTNKHRSSKGGWESWRPPRSLIIRTLRGVRGRGVGIGLIKFLL